jgi:hypothetical protein
MSGVSAPVGTDTYISWVPITLSPGYGRLDYVEWQWQIDKVNLVAWTQQALDIFADIESEVIHNRDVQEEEGLPVEASLTLTPTQCHEYLQRLARIGRRPFQRLFNEEARDYWLSPYKQDKNTLLLAPTFITDRTFFPWELLYEGEDSKVGDPGMFWGLRYAPARILAGTLMKSERYRYGASNMLFCLHKDLREAHHREWPQIERLVKATEQDNIQLFGPAKAFAHIVDGETLLAYLYGSQHNILHFACHADPGEAGADALSISLLNSADLAAIVGSDSSVAEITLNTDAFVDESGELSSKPLVFLNACQTGGGTDELREMYNLPKEFVLCQAGAVIATLCPVPDIFAAEFARVFYGYFLRGHNMMVEQPDQMKIRSLPIGEAMRLTRQYFIEKHHNPLGLAYGLYSSPYYQVDRSVTYPAAQTTLRGAFAS